MKLRIYSLLALVICSFSLFGQFESDVIKTSKGDLEMFFVGHGTLMFEFGELVIHQHGDHLDLTAINHLMNEKTSVIMTSACHKQLEDFDAIVMKNGDRETISGIEIRAIPAYNIAHVRSNGQPYHPKGEGNGYILSFGSTNVLIGGDTENIPEYHDLDLPIEVAFLPMNLPFTMTPEMVADAALAIHPRNLYPYHYGQTDPDELVELLKNEQEMEVRIRDLR